MLHTIKRTFARRAMTLPVIGILAIAATACQGVGLSEARQAVDNQRAINDLEEREVLPIERELETLYETEILPRERELEDLWNQVQDLENGQFKDAYNEFKDPWAPGGAASLLQQEFNEKYAEIDRLYRELEVESRRIQIEQQFGDNSYGGIDPAIAVLEDQRFSLQRDLDRMHQFGRRPIEDLYLKMNELNASNGWSQTDIYAADDLNRQIADIQNEIARAQSAGSQFNDQNQQELFAIENELKSLRTFGFEPVFELRNRISELEFQLANSGDTTTATGFVNADGTENNDIQAEIDRLTAEMNDALASLLGDLEGFEAALQTTKDDAQAQVDALLADAVTVVDPIDTSALVAEIDALNQQIADQQAAVNAIVAGLDVQITDLGVQLGDLYQATDTVIADSVAQIADLQAQIDALDTTAIDYTDVKTGLEGQIAALEADNATAIADEATQATGLQAQIDALTAQKATEQADAEAAIASLQSQIDAKQAEIDAVSSTAGATTTISQEVADQIAAIELTRDAAVAQIQADIDALKVLIDQTENPFKLQIAALESSTNSAGVPTTTDVADVSEIEFEIQTLREQADQLERDVNEKIRVLEERRNKLQSSLEGVAAGGNNITELENKLVHLHDELNALQNSGIDASRNYNLLMEELQTKAVQLEKNLSLDIRALEDQLWELDGRIAELYRSNNGSSFDPYAKFNERLKEIELKRFDLEQRRWDLDDEQRFAFDQFNNYGSEQQAEVDAKRDEVLGPLHEQIDVLEEELRKLNLTQREIEDRLRVARRSVEDQVRVLEDQTLDLIDDAVTAAEEGAEALNSADTSGLEGFDPSLLEGLDASGITIDDLESIGIDPVTGEVVQ